jgi:hypothetical protein
MEPKQARRNRALSQHLQNLLQQFNDIVTLQQLEAYFNDAETILKYK